MKLAYENESRALIYSVKSLLESENIDCHLKNEFSSTTGGADLGISNLTLELWVINDSDLDKAQSIIEAQLTKSANSSDWICSECKEENDGSFESCWKCQTNREA